MFPPRAAAPAAPSRSPISPASISIVSFGADTYVDDPISGFALRTPDYTTIARDIAACGWPTLIAMEGGYAVDALGINVASFLAGF